MLYPYQYDVLPKPGREETAHLARFPATGRRERERVKEISSWLEMAGTEQSASRGERRDKAAAFRRRVHRLSSPPAGLMILIASTILAAGLLFQMARGLAG